MAPHGVKLDTLKQCLEFLQWLHKDSGKQGEVASELFKRINPYYTTNYLNVRDVKEGLSKFLSAVSEFYTRLSKDPAPGNYNNRSADQICNDLLDCVPKFLAAIYFWSTASIIPSNRWAAVVGKKIGQDMRSIGGPMLQAVVTCRNTSEQQSTKKSTAKSPACYPVGSVKTSVFVTSAVADTGTQIPNTANALSLVRTLCDIVLGEPTEGGGSLKVALEHGLQRLVPPKSICWKDLREHCVQLRGKLHKLFNTPKRFDFTGQSTGTDNLNKDELAKHTADWLRGKLIWVRGNLVNIKTDASATSDLGAYFTHNFFPYGFTFESKTRFGMSDKDVRALLGDLSSVIDELRNSGVGDLDRLKEILNGQNKIQCQDPPPPPTKPEAPPAKVPEGAQNQGKKPEGAQNQGKKAEGAQNQGKKSEGSSPASTVVKSAPGPPAGDHGGQGQPGAAGEKGPAGPPTSSSTPTSPVGNDVQHQQNATLPPAHPPPTSPPSAPAGPGIPESTSQPGPPVQGSPEDGSPTIQSGPSQAPVLTQPPNVSGSGAGSTGGQGTGHPGGQNGSQPTNQGADSISSSGVTLSGAPAAGGGGSGYAYYIEPC
ncbi:ribosome binding protein, putative [Babesia ovata]|uniref:Ribosome binding protein, putative n=1 Tax=Babesia ovata TaxID=189622 RepID=A0A2H6KGC7_9APIC|nr:ribosome binding protein, putative [Babesia ovata]GBE62053.1 ribosome binding protein, putative [Babesia ovata]